MYSQKQRDIDNIKSLFFDKVKITEPGYPGAVHDVYIVEHKGEKFIYRFSTKKCALQNVRTSQILRNYKIPVPDIGIYKIGTRYCEVYPFIEGKTLFEKSKEGLSKEQISTIYKQLYDICKKISNIPMKEFEYINGPRTNMDMFFQFMNIAPRVVGHTDLHDKNILIDDNNNVCGIIDLDGVALRPFALLVLRLFQNAEKYGYTTESIKSFNAELYNNKNLLNLTQQANLYDKIKRMFGRIKQ